MKYKALTFDANRPIPQQITEPLNSDYGVAVKVYKDEQLVDADLSVDGVACVDGFDGWKLCDLSTNNDEGMKKIIVAVDKQPTVYAELDTSKTITGTTPPLPAPMGKSVDVIDFAQELPELVGQTINFKDFSFDVAATVTDARGTTYPVFHDTDKRIYMNASDYYYIADDGFLRNGTYYQSITLGEGSKVNVKVNVQQNYSVVFDIDFKVDSKDGLTASFPLYVQQKDFDYFEKRGQKMKYKTITFDANRPIAQQITEPTNSEYGIAVKVYKNNEAVDASKVSIQNAEKVETTEDGWSLYKLNTDGNEGMKTVEVQMTEGGGSSETTKFPLYIQQKDMGYIEVSDVGGGDIEEQED